jgi:ribosomal protein L16 Arg81 hydroxylase
VRFADGKAVRLNRVPGVEVKKDKRTEKAARATITKYWTETTYEVTPEIISELEAGVAIIKLRIVYKANDAKDYEIAEGYQPKMAEDLLKSYKEAALNNKKSNTDLSDEDF